MSLARPGVASCFSSQCHIVLKSDRVQVLPTAHGGTQREADQDFSGISRGSDLFDDFGPRATANNHCTV